MFGYKLLHLFLLWHVPDMTELKCIKCGETRAASLQVRPGDRVARSSLATNGGWEV